MLLKSELCSTQISCQKSYAWAGNPTVVSHVTGKNSAIKPLMHKMTQSSRWRRAKGTPSWTANNAARQKSGMKQPYQFSLWQPKRHDVGQCDIHVDSMSVCQRWFINKIELPLKTILFLYQDAWKVNIFRLTLKRWTYFNVETTSVCQR